MNINAIYDLNACLKASILAGANFINEDIRLKKAIDNIDTIKQESPIFVKISKQCHALLDVEQEKKTDYLFDTITLLDAVLTTLDTALIKEDVVEIENDETYKDEINLDNIQYDIMNKATKAFITHISQPSLKDVCSGNYEILMNFRIFMPFVNYIGISNSYLSKECADYVVNKDIRIVNETFKKDLDKQRKNVTENRLDVIERMDGAKANDLYLDLIPKVSPSVRAKFIYALRFSNENVDYLISICSGNSKIKGARNKDAAIRTLSFLSSENLDKYVEEIVDTNPQNVIVILKDKDTEFAAKMITYIFDKDLNNILKELNKSDKNINIDVLTGSVHDLIKDFKAMHGKKHLEYFNCFLMYLKHLNILRRIPKITYFAKNSFEDNIIEAINSYGDYYIHKDIRDKIISLYEESKEKFLLPNIALCKIIDGSFTYKWIENEIAKLSKKKKNDICQKVIELFNSYFRNDKKEKMLFLYIGKNLITNQKEKKNIDINFIELIEWVYQYNNENIIMEKINSYMGYYRDSEIKEKITLLCEKTKQAFLLSIIAMFKVVDGSFTYKWIENEIKDLSDNIKNMIFLKFIKHFNDSFFTKYSDEYIYLSCDNNKEEIKVDIAVYEILEWVYQYDYDDSNYKDIDKFLSIVKDHIVRDKDNDNEARLRKHGEYMKKMFCFKTRNLCDICGESAFFSRMRDCKVDRRGMLLIIYKANRSVDCLKHFIDELYLTKEEMIEELNTIKDYIKQQDNYSKDDIEDIDYLREDLLKEKYA